MKNLNKVLIAIGLVIIGALGGYWAATKMAEKNIEPNNTESIVDESNDNAEKTAAANKKALLELNGLNSTDILPATFEFLELVKKISPERHKDITKNMDNFDKMSSVEKEKWVNSIMQTTEVLLVERIPYASDESLAQFALIVQYTANYLLEQDASGELCFNHFFPGIINSSQSISNKRYTELDIQMLKVVNMILSSSLAGQNQNLATDGQAEILLANLYRKLESQYGDQLSYLADPAQGAKYPAKTCEIVGDFYGYIAQEPDNASSAKIIRLIMKNL